METNGVLGCVNVSKETRDEIAEDFYCLEREPIHIKGKGIMISYLVIGPKHTLGGVPPLFETGTRNDRGWNPSVFVYKFRKEF